MSSLSREVIQWTRVIVLIITGGGERFVQSSVKRVLYEINAFVSRDWLSHREDRNFGSSTTLQRIPDTLQFVLVVIMTRFVFIRITVHVDWSWGYFYTTISHGAAAPAWWLVTVVLFPFLWSWWCDIQAIIFAHGHGLYMARPMVLVSFQIILVGGIPQSCRLRVMYSCDFILLQHRYGSVLDAGVQPRSWCRFFSQSYIHTFRLFRSPFMQTWNYLHLVVPRYCSNQWKRVPNQRERCSMMK